MKNKYSVLTTAPLKALRNSLRLVEWASDTSVLVTVVPMFAPMMIGMAGRISMTGDKSKSRVIHRVKVSKVSISKWVQSLKSDNG